MMTTKFTDEELMAYVDGEVDDEKAHAIEVAAAADPDIAGTIDMFARTRMMARDAFSSVLRETVPPKLLDTALGRSTKERPSAPIRNIIRLRPPRPSVIAISMAAAACVAVIVAGVAGYVAGAGLRNTDGRAARIELAAASDEISGLLGTVRSGEQATLEGGETFGIIGSFRDRGDRFCREFEISGERNGSLAVACRADGGWAVEFAMQTASSGGYEPASSTAVLDSYLTQIGAGSALSDDEERALLNRDEPGK
jgi:anti-sigma factor RsiW